jgi:hypothetical protein
MSPPLPFEADAPWGNVHLNFSERSRRLYSPKNLLTDGTEPPRDRWRAGLTGLQEIVGEASAANASVRALGGRWSLSDIARTSDFAVNTGWLNHVEVGLAPSLLDASVSDPRHVVFAQCGVRIKELNQILEKAGLALSTSGASNGQSLAGAIATGTHGAANQIGAMHDSVLGLHVVGEDGALAWVERGHPPAVNQTFCDIMGATRCADDELFRAAVVGLGSFGLVHAVLLQVEPIYLLESYVRRYDFDEVLRVVSTLNVEPLMLQGGKGLPFHFEVVVNPYGRAKGQKGAWLRYRHKRAFVPQPPPPSGSIVTSPMSPDVLSLISLGTDILPAVIPTAVGKQMATNLPELSGVIETPAMAFGDTAIFGKKLSQELSVSIIDAGAAIDAVCDVAEKHPFPGFAAMRFVRRSDATLAPTCFAPLTCAIEIPGSGSNLTGVAFQQIWAELDRRKIRYTLHWGQNLPDDGAWVRRGHGDPAVDAWISARRAFLKSAKTRRMFSNPLLDRYLLGG